MLRLLRRLELYPVGSAAMSASMPGSGPGCRSTENGRRDLISLREPFLGGKSWSHPFTAIHGHTIRGPEVLAHRIAVDSGTYRTGVLSAVQIEGDRLRFLSVDQRAQAQGVQAPARPRPAAPIRAAPLPIATGRSSPPRSGA